ncbi:hypothetical protein [Roseovarius sp. SYSU LYC5161]|jgi:hypothetical protein|uniref:hypothetical protein n=1 Tax=Roseovarius halophilus (ex Wu et al. 2025) TaxID=3376060 RepID=UPI00399AB1EE
MTYPQNSDFAVELSALLTDLAEIDEIKAEVSSANGDLRSTVKRILQDRGYHKGALAKIRAINDMPTSKKADFLRTFLPMLEAIRPKWEEEVRDMLDREAEKSDAMQTDMAAE